MPRNSGRSKKSGKSNRSKKTGRRNAGSKSSSLDDPETAGAATDATRDQAARLALRESDKLYYRIGEVSRITGVKAHVLRYWETEFRWMAPPKTRSKQRLYRKRDIEFVWLLKRLLWDERYTIAGARQRIQDLGVDDALALLDQEFASPVMDAASTKGSAGSLGTDVSDANASGPSPASPEWISFRAAIDEMQTELVALRGVLQDGA